MIYLDNGATSFPKAPNVGTKMKECLENYAVNIGRGSYELSKMAEEKVLETRILLKELFNIDSPTNIFFTSSATEGINIGIQGFLRDGDHVITTALEHNSVLRPIKYLESKGVSNTIVPLNHDGEINIKDIEKSIRSNTKLVVVNHVSNVLGTIQDIKSIGALCKEHNIPFMVDAAQSAGKLDIDVKRDNISILAFPGHKGLMGPQGIGGLYIERSLCEKIRPIKFGGTGSNSLDLNQPNLVPDKFESGTLNLPGIVGLGEGLKFIRHETLEKINNKEEELILYLIKELSKLSYIRIYGKFNVKRAGVLSININYMDPAEVGYSLNHRNIAVRTGFHCAGMIHRYINTEKTGTVRISPGYFNTFQDVSKLVEAIKDIYENAFY